MNRCRSRCHHVVSFAQGYRKTMRFNVWVRQRGGNLLFETETRNGERKQAVCWFWFPAFRIVLVWLPFILILRLFPWIMFISLWRKVYVQMSCAEFYIHFTLTTLFSFSVDLCKELWQASLEYFTVYIFEEQLIKWD